MIAEYLEAVKSETELSNYLSEWLWEMYRMGQDGNRVGAHSVVQKVDADMRKLLMKKTVEQIKKEKGFYPYSVKG